MEKLFNELVGNKWFWFVIYILGAVLGFFIIDVIGKLVRKKKDSSIKRTFVKGIFKAIVILATLYNIISLSSVLTKFMNTILLSSSLVVVIMGFVFQEGLSNIVHGVIIALFKPFEIGDRVEITMDSGKISGYVRDMNLRHTTIVGVVDNTKSLIPNSELDKVLIRNLTTENLDNRYPITVSITYEDAQDEAKLKLAKKLLSDAIIDNRLTKNVRANEDTELFVNVVLADSSVDLTCLVNAETAEDNYVACSEIRQALLSSYTKAGINFAYPHLEIITHSPSKEDEKSLNKGKKVGLKNVAATKITKKKEVTDKTN